MAKKFGKFLLFSATAVAAAAGVYYFLKKKEEAKAELDFEDDDYDDFSEDLDDAEPRTYVQLDPAGAQDVDFVEETENAGEGDFSPLADQLQEKKDEQVEEFFDEEQ